MEICVSLPFDSGTRSRQVTAYLPQQPTPDGLFLFCADGQSAPFFAECLQHELIANQFALIGVHSSRTFRGQEYVKGRDDRCFQSHERFFVDVVRDWVETRFSVRLTCYNSAVFGYSCGGSFAVSMGMRHPELFGSVIALSIAGRPIHVDKPPSEQLNLAQSRLYLAAGESEPSSMKKYMKRLASWLRKNGAQSEFAVSPGGHEIAVWQHELCRGIEWLRDTHPRGT